MCFFGDVVSAIASVRGARQVASLHSEHGVHPIFELEHRGERVAFFQPGVGAPLAAAFLEEAIDYGCRRLVACGGAGALDADLTWAVRSSCRPRSATRARRTTIWPRPGSSRPLRRSCR
jgi:hypothetical protein